MMHDSAPSPASLISEDDARKKNASRCGCGCKFVVLALATTFGLSAVLWHFGLNSVFGVIDVSTPDYEVLDRGQGYEIRRYPTSTAIATEGSAHGGNSFMRLAGFIGVMGKPQNDRNEKIAMTAPVVTMQSNEGEQMQFILPSNFNGSAPQPTGQGVHVVTRPSSVFGVETFSGSWSTHEAEERAKKLSIKLKADGYTLREHTPWQYFRYNPPWTLSVFRTNEVAVPIHWPPSAKPLTASAANNVYST